MDHNMEWGFGTMKIYIIREETDELQEVEAVPNDRFGFPPGTTMLSEKRWNAMMSKLKTEEAILDALGAHALNVETR